MSTVTVYLPTKDRLSCLKRAVGSVLIQTVPNFELIVVNDNSSDGTKGWLDHLQRSDSRVKTIHFSKNRGACAARNAAIDLAATDFVTGLDDDDYFLPRRLEVLLGHWDNRHSAVTSNDAFLYKTKTINTCKPRFITYDHIKYCNHVGNQVLTRRKHLIDIGRFDEKLRGAQDYDLWIRLIRNFGPCKVVNEVTMCVDRSDDRLRISNSLPREKLNAEFIAKHKIGPRDTAGSLAFVLMTGDTSQVGYFDMLLWVLSWHIPWRVKRRLVRVCLVNFRLYSP